MSSAKRSSSIAACVEDVNEDTGSVIEGTVKYAKSAAASPTRKQQSNIGKSRKEARGRSPNSHRQFSYANASDEENAPPPRRQGRPVEREKPKRPTIRPSAGPPRPSAIQSAGPRPSESPEYYGVPSPGHLPPPGHHHPPPGHQHPPPGHQHPPPGHHHLPPGHHQSPGHHQARPIPRPRANTAAMPRPPSFHADSRPPPSHSAHYGRYASQGPPPLATSFPAPSWYSGTPPGPPVDHPAALPPIPRNPMSAPGDPYQPQNFPPPQQLQYGNPGRGRPHSSMGHHPQQSYDFEDAFGGHDDIPGGPPPPGPLARRPSVSQRRRDMRERAEMPPPPHPSMRPDIRPGLRSESRPRSAIPANSIVFRPPPDEVVSTRPRKALFPSDEDDSDVGYSHIDAHAASLEYDIPEQRYLPPPPSRSVVPRSQGRRTSMNGDRSVSYSNPSYQQQMVPRNRRHSGFGESFSSSVPEDSEYSSDDDELSKKMKTVQMYTNAPAAPPPPRSGPQRLTQNALRRVSTHGGSSRSTESSESIDESEMPSHTTRTTHSIADEDGGAAVKIRGAKNIRLHGVDIKLDGDNCEIELAPRNNERALSYRGERDDGSMSHRTDERRLQYEQPPRPALAQRMSSRADSFSRSRTAQPQFGGSGYAPPPTPSHYGFPSPAGQYPEIEWEPPAPSWDSRPSADYYQ